MKSGTASAPSPCNSILVRVRQDATEHQPAPPRVEPQPFRVSAGLVDRLIEETRFRADFQRAALRIGNQELALTRRLTGCAKGEAPKILKQALALANSDCHPLKAMAGPVNGTTRARKSHPHYSADPMAASNGEGIAQSTNQQPYRASASPLILIATICAKFEEAKKPLLAAQAERFGFCPRRRALMHVLGECLLRSGDEYYRGVYDSRKAYELEREPELKPIAAHMRAMRFMQKRFLRELWLAWTGVKRLSGGTSSERLRDNPYTIDCPPGRE